MNMARFRRVYNNRPFVYKEYKFSENSYESIINPRVFRINLRYVETLTSDRIIIDEILYGDGFQNKGIAFDLKTLVGVDTPSTELYFEVPSNKRASQQKFKQFLVDLNFEGIKEFIVCSNPNIQITNIDEFISTYILSKYRINEVSEWVRL
jgi:hypothetical protein